MNCNTPEEPRLQTTVRQLGLESSIRHERGLWILICFVLAERTRQLWPATVLEEGKPRHQTRPAGGRKPRHQTRPDVGREPRHQTRPDGGREREK